MKYSRNVNELPFNPAPSTIMHIDLNSCFATIEQQANPLLRGKPVAVAAYTTPGGCIVAPSIEAKKLGIKVGMRVKDGKSICPDLVILPPDPWKYRNVHIALRKIISDYTNDLSPKSIDEFVLNLKGYPCLLPLRVPPLKVVAQYYSPIEKVALEIKKRIKREVGEWITVSIGIAPNRFLAKTAASLRKPDGLDEINRHNFKNVYKGLSLTDLCGIKIQNSARLNSAGIYSVLDFYEADIRKLRGAFNSIAGYYWYLRLRGWEIDDVDFARRSYGNSYALPKPFKTPDLSPILMKLVVKMAQRLRHAGYKARGIHLSVLYRDWSHWHKGISFENALFDSREIYKKAYKIMSMAPSRKPVRELAVSCFNLFSSKDSQLELFDDIEKRESLVSSIDKINNRWGDYVVTPARMIWAKENVPDRIAFGGVKELEEFTLR